MFSVYLVDDEPLVLTFLSNRAVFLESGFQVSGTSTNALTALEEIQSMKPDVVITDLKMPGLTGIALMERLRETGCSAEFVIISAYSDFAEVRRFFTTSGFDYLIKPVSDHDLEHLLQRLSMKLNGAPPVAPRSTPSKELNEMLDYLKTYLAMRHTLESLGEKYGFHPNYICNLFAKYLQTTFTAYMTQLRMEKAQELLLHTEKPIKEIAITCGYNDYFYFCRVFRKQNHCPPTRYREAGGGP